MTKKDFFRVLIKLFGLYAATITIFTSLPTYIGYATIDSDIAGSMIAIGTLIIIAFLLMGLVYGTDKIISMLNLDKGFDDQRLEIGNLTEMSILKLAIILLGGFLIIDNIPVFLNQCYLAFREQVSSDGILTSVTNYMYDTVSYFELSVAAISILIGYLLITNYIRVAKSILKTNTSK